MKKLAALILVLLLVLPMTVLAEEPAEATAETVTEIITWENMTAQEEIGKYAAYGSFIKLDKLGLTMWLRDGLTEKEAQEPVVYYFADPTDGTGVTVFLEEIEGVNTTDREALLQYVRENLDPEARASEINGLYCINYTLGADDLMQALLTFPAGEGRALTFVFEPFQQGMSSDSIAILLMAASIQEIPAE